MNLDKITTLNNLPLNCYAIVSSINCKGKTRRRLLDLGLVPGTGISPILISPCGDPKGFQFRGSLIAIRDEECKLINIKLV